MIAQHTRGPWHLSPISGGYRRTGGFKIDPKDGHGAIAKVSYRYTMTNNLAEGQANAALIAAAPDLLAALERIAGYEAGSRGAYSKFAGSQEIARAAIAKAEVRT